MTFFKLLSNKITAHKKSLLDLKTQICQEHTKWKYMNDKLENKVLTVL